MIFKKQFSAIKQTIGSRLVVYVVLFSTAMMIIVTGIQLYLDYKNDLKVIDSRLQQIENVSLRTLAHGLWIADKKNMLFHLEGLAELPDMQYFEIRDEGKKWASTGHKGRKNTIKRIYPLNYTYKNEKYIIGSLVVIASLSGVYDRLINRAWLVLISNGVKTFIVSIFLLLMFNHLVSRHMYRITKYVKSLKLENLASPLQLEYSNKKHYERNDEINTLTEGINAMREALYRTTEELKNREQHIALTLDCVGDAVIATDQDGKITRFNPIAEVLTERSSTEVIGLHLSQVFTLIDADSLKPIILRGDIRKYLSDITALAHNTALLDHQSIKHRISVSASTIEDQQQAVLGLILTFRDTTQEYNTQLLIQKSQQRLQFHHKNTPLGVIEWNEQLKIIEWNPSAEHIFGYKLEQVYQKTLDQLLPAASEEQAISIVEFWRKLNTSDKGSNNLVIINKTSTGDLLWCEWYNTILTDENGNMVGVVCLVANITDRKKTEAELEKYRLQLEGLVLERTAKLEATNRELDAFCSSVSHDLRAPLRSIEGFSHILSEELEHKLSSEHKNYFSRIRSATSKMGQLINDLLNLSRITRATIKKEELNLSEMVMNAIHPLQELEPARTVDILVENNIMATGDPRYIQVAIDNLVNNAWKYSAKKAHARIEFGVQTVDDKPTYYIRDNGAGFDERFSNKLFIAFQRLHKSGEFDGSGIGLATTQRAIEQHGGEIWAKSKVGEGATFYFRLE